MGQNDVAVQVGAAFEERMRTSNLNVEELGRYLDGLTPASRLHVVHSLTGAQQARLHEAAKGVRKLTLDDLVPSATAPLAEVVHEGKNSLPLFTHFAKVFCRPKPDVQEAWGYNRTSAFVQTVVGPGYYVAYEGPGDEVLIDYTRLPKGKAASWPEIASNDSRLSRFVYAGMIDALRGVSKHVSVGRAIRNGKVQDNWFVLCRVDR